MLFPRLKSILGVVLACLLAGCAGTRAVNSPAAAQASTPSLLAVNPAAAAEGSTSSLPAATPVPTWTLPPTLTRQPTAAVTAAPTSAQPSPAVTATEPPPTLVSTGSQRKPPKYWAEWPLVPDGLSAKAKAIFLHGQQLGNDVHSFTTIGDCQSQPNIFMGVYDTAGYHLDAQDAALEETIQQFKGSFARDSVAVKDGESVASVFAPAWADPKQCQPGETPLDCEFRLHKPVIVFINLGTNWMGGDDVKHEQYLRKIVDYAIQKGVVPIISSKGDNLEGGHRINQSNARVAYDDELPFWNFWTSIRDLPGKGIDGTRPGGYLIPDAWPIRSLTGLKALDAVWRELKPLMK